jgi:cytochrome c-type biogenesis protein CcmH
MMEGKIMRRHLWLGLITISFILILLAIPLSVFAQGGSPTDDEVNAIAKQLYCPVCENVPLDVCPTQACEQWRATIREKLELGWSEEQIKQYFVDQYGARVLATPPAEGLNLLVYILPPLAFIAGAGILAWVVRNWRSEKEVQVPEAMTTDDPYIARIEEELQRREGTGS